MKTYRFAPFFVIHDTVPSKIQATKQFLDVHWVGINVEGMKLFFKGGERYVTYVL